MHRLLVANGTLRQDCPELPGPVAKHLNVIRPADGETVELFDGCGHAREFRWRDRALAASGDVRFFPRPQPELVLFACITKGSRWDWTVEKATELGVSRIVPVISERTIVRIPAAERAAKRERWLRIAAAAAEQSDAKWLPEIDAAVDFPAALRLAAGTKCFAGALTEPPAPPLLDAVRGAAASNPQAFAAFIGPEGDFSPAELARLLEIAVPASFGTSVLRAETAAVYAMSVLSAARSAGGLL